MHYYYLKRQAVKTNSGNMLADYLEITDDSKTNVILESPKIIPNVNPHRIYHIDNGIEETYTGSLITRFPISEGYEENDYRPGKPQSQTKFDDYGYFLIPPDNLLELPEDIIGIIIAIISQPKLKADDVEKELKALGYDLEFKPFKLLTSNGWRAKRISDSEKFEPISQLIMSLISQT